MFNTKKYKHYVIIATVIMLLSMLISVAISYVKTIPHYNVYRLTPEMSEFFVYETPKDFCEKKGNDTIWENAYSFAWVDWKGNLILVLTDEEIEYYKWNSHDLQVLQAVLGDSRDIGVQINYDYDPLYYLEFAPRCGIQISEDFRTFTKGPGGNRLFVPIIATACMTMQLLNGVPSDEIKVDYYLYDENGNVEQHLSYPEDLDKEIVLK